MIGYSVDSVSRRFTAPRRGVASAPGQELLGVVTSHGPSRESYPSAEKSSYWPTEAAAAAEVSAERCGQRFGPRQARQRYCSEGCRKAARKWSRWKAQQKYRTTDGGRQKRKGQGRRYRERVKSRKPPESEAVSESARVITQEHFFRAHLRPAGVLRRIRPTAAKSLAALLLRLVPACAGAGPAAGAALETSAHLSQRY